jgi:MutS domain V/MutS domain I
MRSTWDVAFVVLVGMILSTVRATSRRSPTVAPARLCFGFYPQTRSRVWSPATRRQSSACLARDDSILEEDVSVSSKLEALQVQIAALNGGQSINCNSPKQVAAAIFGSAQSASKAVLQQAAAGEHPELDERGQQLAALVLQYRSLQSAAAAAVTPEGGEQGDWTSATTASISDEVPDEMKAIDTDQRPDPITTGREDDHSSYESLVEGIFSKPKNEIHNYWKDALLQISRPSARALVAQLDPEQCPMGYDPLAAPFDPLRRSDSATSSLSTTTTAGKKGSFLAFCREQKEKYPDCIMLTRCGDFYETFGIDAILLVEHCGLNAMAGKAKAGCPIRNVQATLDCLTAAGFRIAVYEEGVDTDASAGSGATAGAKSRIKSRFLAQIVSSASPTYLYDLVLIGNSADTLATGLISRPYVGILSSRAGYTLTEVSVEERSVRVSERLTAEAVACRLAAYPPADPLFYVPSAGEYETGTPKALPFLPSRMDTSSSGPGARLRTRILPPTLVQQEGGGVSEVERAKNVFVSTLLQLTECKDDDESDSRRRATVDDFTLVSSSEDSSTNGTHTNPLYLETATQLGLMNDGAIPSLVSYLLPDSAPAATRRFLRRLLLTPPPPAVGEAMAKLVSFLKQDDGPALPPLSVPPVGKVLAMVRAGQASALVYSELLRALDATNLILDVLEREDDSDVVKSLMTLLEYESGMAADPSSLKRRCLDAIDVIEDVLCPIHHVNSGTRSSGADDDELVTDFGDLIPRAFFERNEATWRGRVQKDATPEAYERVQESAKQLARAVASDFWGLDLTDEPRNSQDDNSLLVEGRKNVVIVQDIFNNLIALKEVPGTKLDDAKYVHPRDRNGKVLRNRYTTEAVQTALSDYVAACDSACGEVSAALVRLSHTLHDYGHIPAIVQASHANLILSAAFFHSVKVNALGWSLAETVEASPGIDSAGHFKALWPYWMDRSEAVRNTFDLSGMWVLTAPNMSGKSTLMRSTAAAALLAVCGLCAPLDPGSTVRRFDHIFVRGASSDVPTEQKSAFGAEMGDVAALLRCCGEKSLVFVDELGRGTSPRDGTRLSGAVLEAMAEAGMSGIFATHLHDILKLPLQSMDRVVKKRMAIHERDNTGHEFSRYSWTYRLEDGVCTDSMALVTAEKFGLPSHVIQRAEALSEYLPSTSPVVSPDTPMIAGVANEVQNGASQPRFLPDIRQVIDEITGRRAVKISPGWSVPASYDGKSAVYILKLDTEPARYYVGETDNLRKRIEQHRSKGGIWSNFEAVVVPAPRGKSQARMWESRLIRNMASAGFEMQSITDGRTLRALNNGQFVDDSWRL